jgi:hypothetical protein
MFRAVALVATAHEQPTEPQPRVLRNVAGARRWSNNGKRLVLGKKTDACWIRKPK